MKQVVNPEQLSLLPAEVTAAIEGVFGRKEVKNAKGATVGTRVSVISRKEIAAAFGLSPKKDKAAIDGLTLEAQDKAFTSVKAGLVNLPKEYTLHQMTERVVGDGIHQITITARKITRQTGPTDEQIATKLGWTVERVREAREQQEAKLKTGIVDLAPATPEPEKAQAAA